MLGSTPSNLIDYFDFNRFAELLCDSGETAVTTTAALNALPRAVKLVQAAESIVCRACASRNTYTLQQLRDLVRDYQLPAGTTSGTGVYLHAVGISGGQLMELIADVCWCQANRRKRYAVDSPQSKDPSCERAEMVLDQLRAGERIFVLDGVMVYDSLGVWTGEWYGSDVQNAGLLDSGSLNTGSGIDCVPHLWGCKINRSCDGPSSSSNPCC